MNEREKSVDSQEEIILTETEYIFPKCPPMLAPEAHNVIRLSYTFILGQTYERKTWYLGSQILIFGEFLHATGHANANVSKILTTHNQF